jgi:hypothetical protein
MSSDSIYNSCSVPQELSDHEIDERGQELVSLPVPPHTLPETEHLSTLYCLVHFRATN